MTTFYKVSGAGNDFIALIDVEPPSGDAVRAWCRRGFSLGADGVFVLRRRGDDVVSMLHFNADGGRAELCLNGSRCAARLCGELGWDRDGSIQLETDSGRLDCRIEDSDRVSIALPAALDGPALDSPALDGPAPDGPAQDGPAVHGPAAEASAVKAVRLETPLGVFGGHFLEVGVPHLVVSVDALRVETPADVDLPSLGPLLRAHPKLGPAGANVNVVRFRSRREVDLRTFERGVEGETLACGTGAVAAVRVGVWTGALDAPQEETPVAVFTTGGFELGVGTRGGATTLSGDARLVARGELLPGSVA